MLRKKSLQIGVLILFLWMTACAPALTPPPEGLLETMIAATVQSLPTNTPYPTVTQTITAAAPRLLPTEAFTSTPFPSLTPLPTFTLTPTLTETPTEVGVGSRQGIYQGHGNFACIVMNQKPINWSRFRPNSVINATWTVQNAGAMAWRPNHVKIVYEDGDRIFERGHRERDLTFTVEPGQTRDITVQLRMPQKGGDYRVIFGLERGGDIFCRLIIGVSVR